MRGFLSAILGLDQERTIWIEEPDLGKEKVIQHRNKRYAVKIPQRIDRTVDLRLRGLGRTKGNEVGDLVLHIWLNQGDDLRTSLWLSESSASKGARKMLRLDESRIEVAIPRNSHDGLVVRLRGLGRRREFTWRAPFLHRKRGNLLVKLFVYPDSITPRYGSFEALATGDMALEGWVYRKLDEVLQKLGQSSFPASPLQADAVADAFNEHGWRGIFEVLLRHLMLERLNIEIAASGSLAQPGTCQRTATMRYPVPVTKSIVSTSGGTRGNPLQGSTHVESSYKITISERFLDNPFSVAAILAHELCHAVYAERVDSSPWPAAEGSMPERESKEAERTVDLLVFMLGLGEFQLRVARDSRLTFGYFNQETFERIQVIVSRKRGAT